MMIRYKDLLDEKGLVAPGKKTAEILIVDDDIDFQDIIGMALKEKGYIVSHAYNAGEAEFILAKNKVDLILLDLMLPDLDGFTACRTLQTIHPEKFIPIIMISAKADIQSKVQCLEEGAVDFLTKPFSVNELHARVKSMLRIKDLQDQLKALAITDELTGLYNRRFFQEWLNLEFKRTLRYKTSLSCLMIDIDYFKNINDTYGHAMGDFVLREISLIIKNNTRGTDIAARYGGEEFMLLLPRTDKPLAMGLAERIRASIEAANFTKDDISTNATVSIGIASSVRGNLEDKEQLIEFADKALYDAKRHGRNRVIYSGLAKQYSA
ncbi:MAG: diguanylate cyclase [bacterium]